MLHRKKLIKLIVLTDIQRKRLYKCFTRQNTDLSQTDLRRVHTNRINESCTDTPPRTSHGVIKLLLACQAFLCAVVLSQRRKHFVTKLSCHQSWEKLRLASYSKHSAAVDCISPGLPYQALPLPLPVLNLSERCFAITGA